LSKQHFSVEIINQHNYKLNYLKHGIFKIEPGPAGL